jgi:acyl-CoA dehydrogenase
MKLSTEDLSLFFDERHHVLAAKLSRIARPLEDTPHGPEGAIRVAREMGDDLGLYSLLVPEALGGAPAGKADDRAHVDVRSLCLVREMLGYACPMADSIFAVQGLGSYPLVLAGSRTQQEAYLPGVLSGERIGAFALTEPEAGSDVAAMRCVARKDGDGFVLDGEKVFISNATIASHYVVFANADPAAGRKGISAFLVDAGTPGLDVTGTAMSIDHPIGRLRFQQCRLEGASLLGAVGEGFKLAMRTLDTFRVTVGAAAVGMARRALDETIRRVRSRSQFGKPLAEQPVIQSMVANMATELDAARLLVLRAARAKDTGKERVSTEAAMAKLYATEAAQRIIDTAVQLHGGMGVVEGEVVERLYREIRPLRIYEGTSEIQRIIIGTSVLSAPREAKPSTAG